MKKVIFIYSLICCSFQAYVLDYFEKLLISQPSYLPETMIGIADIRNRYSIEKKLGMTIASSIVHYTIGYLFKKPESTPKECAECLTRILSANEQYICEYSGIREYYEIGISCLETLHGKYEVCKWMLDESTYIVNRYNPNFILSSIIHALEIINENYESTTFSELINGGWRNSDEIIRALKLEQ